MTRVMSSDALGSTLRNPKGASSPMSHHLTVAAGAPCRRGSPVVAATGPPGAGRRGKRLIAPEHLEQLLVGPSR